VGADPRDSPAPQQGPPAPGLHALGLFFARPCHLDAGMFPGQHGDRRGSLPASALSGGRERYPPVGRVDIPSTGQGYRPALRMRRGRRDIRAEAVPRLEGCAYIRRHLLKIVVLSALAEAA
jgi:hypothetical protein